jgi:transcriptional regulator with XRE-family HTH domain
MSFAEALRALMDERGFTTNGLAAQVPCDKALISRYRNGRQQPSQRMARRMDEVLDAGGRLAGLAVGAPAEAPAVEFGDEIAALELSRRATASDVGITTMERLEQAVDSLAIAYPGTPRPCCCRVSGRIWGT